MAEEVLERGAMVKDLHDIVLRVEAAVAGADPARGRPSVEMGVERGASLLTDSVRLVVGRPQSLPQAGPPPTPGSDTPRGPERRRRAPPRRSG